MLIPHFFAQVCCDHWKLGGFRGVCGEAGLGIHETGSWTAMDEQPLLDLIAAGKELLALIESLVCWGHVGLPSLKLNLTNTIKAPGMWSLGSAQPKSRFSNPWVEVLAAIRGADAFGCGTLTSS